MSMTSWNPVEELDVLRSRMNRMLNQLMGPGMTMLPRLEMGRSFLPSVDMYTSGKELILKAELPGVGPEDITVDMTESSLHLAGEVRRDSEISEDAYYRTERQYGRFERVIPLPLRIKDQEAKASFKNGLLTIRAPLAEELKLPKGTKLTIETK